jgi:hypothetical protein
VLFFGRECYFLDNLSAAFVLERQKGGSLYRSGRSPDWLKMKNPPCAAVKREAEEDWGEDRRR